MSRELLTINNLCKSFGPVEVLKDINLSVMEGDFIAIKGRSGSGKSTLLSIMGLLDEASSGSFKLCAQDVSSLKTQQLSFLRNRHIGWVFQNFNLIGDMTVYENIVMPYKYRPDNYCREYLTELLTTLELDGKLNSYPKQLSGGQQQRVAIARALITNPDLIMADEPTGNLDEHNGKRISELFLKLNKSGKTIVLITHDDEVASYAKTQITINDGKLVTGAI